MFKLKHAACVALVAFMAFVPNASAHTAKPERCYKQAESRDDRAAFLRKCLAYVEAHNLQHACRPPRPLVSATVTVKHRRATIAQRRIITRILNLGRKLNAPPSHQVAAIAAATQESTIANLRGGHGSSVGILQLISDHGSVSWRRTIENSAGWFFRGAKKLDPRGNARLATTGYGHGLIQRVQKSGHPYAYNQWISEARRTYRLFLRGCHR